MAVSVAELIIPDWPAPANVRAVQTTRSGGFSEGSYASFNLGDHVGDDSAVVARNRELLIEVAGLPAQPCWLNQVHGVSLVKADSFAAPPQADAAWTDEAGVVCAVLTADCLPLLFCNRVGNQVAAAHAGWRGMSTGVIEQTVEHLLKGGGEAEDLLVWLGPAIGPEAYEVDTPVYDGFLAHEPECEKAFTVSRPGHWQFNLYAAARSLLARIGVQAIYGGDYCTSRNARFFSHRNEAPCGRQATLIWLQ